MKTAMNASIIILLALGLQALFAASAPATKAVGGQLAQTAVAVTACEEIVEFAEVDGQTRSLRQTTCGEEIELQLCEQEDGVVTCDSRVATPTTDAFCETRDGTRRCEHIPQPSESLEEFLSGD